MINKVTASYSDLLNILPEEAKILTGFQSEEVLFRVENNVLKISYGDYSPTFIDIDSELERHKIQFYKASPYKELLAKAIGIKAGKDKLDVLDATGGMLGDSLLIYAIGVKTLTVCERHPVPAALITNALRHSGAHIIFHHDAASSLEETFDVIFYDPMYSEKNVKTNAKKEMMIFRDIIGADADIQETAKNLLKMATNRLVIKRSVKAKPLMADPSIIFKGKSTAYDVYLKN